jgi:hypothetical protein
VEVAAGASDSQVLYYLYSPGDHSDSEATETTETVAAVALNAVAVDSATRTFDETILLSLLVIFI